MYSIPNEIHDGHYKRQKRLFFLCTVRQGITKES